MLFDKNVIQNIDLILHRQHHKARAGPEGDKETLCILFA